MQKILNYFKPEKEQEYFEKQKTNAFIVLGLFGALIALVFSVSNVIFMDDNYVLNISIPLVLFFYIFMNLFILRKTDIVITGNIFSIGFVVLLAIGIIIIDKDISILYKFTGGFYTIIGVYSISVLLASRKVIIFNGIIILLSTTRVFYYVLKNDIEPFIILKSAFIEHTIALITIFLVYYFTNKYTKNAIEVAQKDARIKDEQNKKYAILNKELLLSEEEVRKHKQSLEITVIERTKELKITNEELVASNEDLYEKNKIIENQHKKLDVAFKHLQETQSSLLQSEKMASLGILTAGVAHEINNPLNYIMGSYVGLERYFKGAEKNNEKTQILLNGLKTGVDRAAGIVKSLNQFSRSNDNYTEDCEIHSVIDNCLIILNNQVNNRIEINKEFSDEIIMIPGNIGKLHQVFINILTNSIQAIEGNGAISILSRKKDGYIEIKISDSGSGISKDILAKITDPFFTTKDPGHGVGLGLSITYSIIQEHKGNISFHSENNEGTTVIITLPLKK